jgi:hypothetical protein
LLLLSILNNVFLQEKASVEADDADHQLWRIRYENARQRLQEAGISVTDDLQRSLESYIEQRRRGITSSDYLAVPWLISLQKLIQRCPGQADTPSQRAVRWMRFGASITRIRGLKRDVRFRAICPRVAIAD